MTEIRSPFCPRCKQPPTLVISEQQALCGTEGCRVWCWDMTRDAATFEATAVVIDPLEKFRCPDPPGCGAPSIGGPDHCGLCGTKFDG